MEFSAGLALLKRFWWVIPLALFLGWVWRIDSLRAAHKQALVECRDNHAKFVADVKAKTEIARKLDAAHKAEVEARQAQISQENDNEIRRKIAAAVAAVSKRVQLTPAVPPGRSGSPAVSSAPVAPASAAGAGETAVVPAADLAICATNTVLAEGWQTWWKPIAAIPR